MRASVTSLGQKLLATFFAATLALGLVPVTAFAEDNDFEAPKSEGFAEADSPTTENLDLQHVISSEVTEGDGVEESGEGLTDSFGEAETRDNAIGSENATLPIPAALERINVDVALTTPIAQQESTRSYFLAQTLESTKTVPIVSANLPLDTGSVDIAEPEGEDSSSEDEGDAESDDPDSESDPAPVDASFSLHPENADSAVSAESTVIGSFTYLGMTFAVEPGGESVALVAVDYGQLPEEFIEKQVIVIPQAAASNDYDYYSVTRIADNAFSSLTKQNANSDFKGCEVLFADEELLAEAGIDATEVEAFLNPESDMVDIDGDGEADVPANPLKDCTGILALGIPASVTSISDDALAGFDTLQYLVISEDNPNYASFDGVLYDADLTNLRLIPEGRVGAVRVAPSAATVEPEVFSHCPSLTTVVADPESTAYQSIMDAGFRNGAGNEIDTVDSWIAFPTRLDSFWYKYFAYLDLHMKNGGISFVTSELSTRSISSGVSSISIPRPSGWTEVGRYDAADYLSLPGNSVSIWPVSNQFGALFMTYSRWSDIGIGWSVRNSTDRPVVGRDYSFHLVSCTQSSKYPNLRGDRTFSGGSETQAPYTFDLFFNQPVGFWARARNVGVDTDGYQYFGAAQQIGDSVLNTHCSTGVIILKNDKPVRQWDVLDFYGLSPTEIHKSFYMQYVVIFVCEPALSFELAGGTYGSLVDTGSIAGASPYTLSPPRKEGNVFLGWTFDSAENAIPNADTKLNSYGYYPSGTTLTLRGNVTFTAHWGNTVTLDAKGGTGGTSSVTAVYGSAMPAMTKPTKEHYTFAGYYDVDATTGGNKYYSNAGTSCRNWDKEIHTTLYARYTPETYTITYEMNGHGVAPSGDADLEYSYGKGKNLANPASVVGYTFGGWYQEKECVNEASITKTTFGPQTVWANWIPNISTVTFDASVSGQGSITKKAFATFGANLPALPSDVSRAGIDGMYFAGYFDEKGKKYYDENGNAVAGLTWDKDGDTILYARLKANKYYVSFNSNGGEGGQSETVKATFGEPMPSISNTEPIRAGYTFQGWYDGTDYESATQYYTDKGVSARTWNKTSVAILYAGWKANEYAVSFDAGKDAIGGQTDTVTATFDSPLMAAISEMPPVRAGCTFEGWYNAEEGGTCFYSKDGTPTGEAWKTVGNGTLYARWSFDAYTITLSPRAPEGETDNEVMKGDAPFYSSTVIEGVDYFSTLSKFDPQVPVIACDGYAFGGWKLEGENRVLFDADGHGQGTYGLEEDALCVPVWTPRTWKVKWDYAMPATAEAKDADTTTETFNATCKGVADPECDGWRFDGWRRGSSAIVPGESTFRPTDDDLDAEEIVYTATWRAIEYEVVLLSGEHATYANMDSSYVTADDAYVYPYTVADAKWMLVEPDDDPGYDTMYWEIMQKDGTFIRYDYTYVSPREFRDTDGALMFRAVQKAVSSTIELAPGNDMPDEALADAPWKKHSYSLDESVKLPEIMTYPGYTFAGWKLISEDGKEVQGASVLAPGTEIVAPENQNPLSRVYTAVWERDAYTVVFLRSEKNPYEVAPSVAGVAYEEEFTVPYANFRDAFTNGTPEEDVLKDTTGRILRYYEAFEGKGVYLQGQSLTVKEILEAYPAKKATSADGSSSYEIALYGSWTTSYHVDVPLTVNVSFDPERPTESLIYGEGFLRFTQDYVSLPKVDVVGLICEPVTANTSGPGTEAVFDSDDDFLSGTYLTLAAKQEGSIPVEFNLGSVTMAGTSGLPLTGTTADGAYTRLPDLGFTFGGEERTLDLVFGLRFDEGLDASNLVYLKSNGVLDANRQVPIARIYYTLALQSASI